MSASRVTNTSVISRGYGEKTELQDLNKILEDSLKEMQDLQESTAEFEKQIAIMEEHAERQVKQRCMKIERHNQTLKTNQRTETNEKDRAQEEQEELERQIEVLEASKAANLQAMNEALQDTERLTIEIENNKLAFPDLRAELAARKKDNAELKKTLKAAESEFAVAKTEFDKRAAEAEAIGKKHQGLVDRLYTIETDGREAEQLHKLVIQRLTNILGEGPGDLDGEWQMLKDALKEEHELELQTLTEEKTLKWRFELNKLDHEIAAAGVRLEAARDRKRQADMDLGGMHQEVEELKRELENLRLQVEQEAADEAYNPNVLDDLIRELEALVARKEQDIKRINSQIAQLMKQIEKLQGELAELKMKSAEARLALAWEQVLLQKALENVKNAEARKVAEEEDAADGAGRLSVVIDEKKANIKDLNDSIAELKQLEMDVAGLRAEIDKYTKLLEMVPDPTKGSTPKGGGKRRRTEGTEVEAVATVTVESGGGSSKVTKRSKTTTTTVTKTSAVKSSRKTKASATKASATKASAPGTPRALARLQD